MKKHLIPFIIILASIVMSVVAYPHLPAEIPTHWGLDGEVNRYSGKLFALSMIPLILTLVYGMMVFLPKIDPKKENYTKFMDSYRIIIYSIMAFTLVVQAITILIPLGYDININVVIPVLIGLLFIILGNYMQRAKQNFFLGVKTPWTLSNEVVWTKTHRLASRLFVLSGICFVVVGFLPNAWMLPVMILSIILASIVPIVASYLYYREEMKK